MSFVKKFFAGLALALVAMISSVMAQSTHPLDGAAGYDPKEATGWLQISFSDVAADGSYVVITAGQFAVSDVDLGMPELLIQQTKNPKTQAPEWHYRIPAGTLHPMPLGKNWGSTPTNPREIDVTKIKFNGKSVVGQITNGASSLTFTRAAGEKTRPINFVVRFTNGKQAWGSQTGQKVGDSPWTAVTVDGNPLVVWSYQGDKVVPPAEPVIMAFATQK